MPSSVPTAFAAQDNGKHYKMCKKIAQLTKVIYTLNNCSEDNEQRTEWLHQMHRQEIAQLCQQYESELEKLQQQVCTLQTDKRNIATSIERSLKEQLQAAQEAFMTRLAALSQQASEQELSYDSSLREEKQRMAAELAAETKRVRESKDVELQSLVREYNDKYKAMLAEQLDSRDALETALKKEWGSKVEALQMELAAAQGDMKAQLQSKSKLLQETLQRCATLSSEKDLSAASLNEAQAQLQAFQGQLRRTEEELASERRRGAVAEELENQRETRRVALESDRTALQRENTKVQESLAAEKALNARQAAAIQALENEKASLSTSREGLTQELEDCKAALAACTAQRDAAEGELRDLHSCSAAHASSLSDATSQLGEAKQRIIFLEQAVAEGQRKHGEEAAQAQQRLAAASRQAAEEARASQAKHEEELRNARESLQWNLSSEQQRLIETHTKVLEELKRQHETEMRRLQTEMAATQESFERASRKADATAALVSSLTVRSEEQDALLRSRAEESAAERLQLEQQLQQLQLEVSAARNNGAKETAAQVAALERTQAEHAADCAAADAAHTKALCEAEEKSAAQLDRIRLDHAMLLKAIQEQHSIAMQRAKEDAAAQAASMSTSVETRLAAQQRDYEERLAVVRTAAATTEGQLHTRITELQAQLRQTVNEMSTLQASSSEGLRQRQADLAQLQSAMAKAQAEAAASLDSARRDAEEQRRNEVNSLEVMRQEQVSAERQRYEVAVAAHNEEIARMKAHAHERMAATETRLQETKASLEAMRIKGMEELEGRLNMMHQRQVRELAEAHDTERDQLQGSIGAMNVRLKELISSLASKAEALEELIAQRDRLLEDLTTAKRNGAAAVTAEQNRRAADLEELRLAHQKELNALSATHKEIVDDFSHQQAEERRAHQALVDQLHSTTEELQYKYNYRESRPEDVELINKLLLDIKEKECALNKAYEDMRLYKLELINREENYNKVFGRHPTVADYSGVAHAATKGQSALPSIGAPRKYSTR
ncbi:hypothetical protein Q4I28_007730 [Leishmania naiffi]|uniref:Protein FAM184A/B N-terminal domain-containing protein n=1 Tax=Leishmania naiffi TaxID=5678 RepID=A0AAW3B980_9TRYP